MGLLSEPSTKNAITTTNKMRAKKAASMVKPMPNMIGLEDVESLFASGFSLIAGLGFESV